MAYAYPSQSNVFLPSFEASGKLLVDYSRKPSDFQVMSYLQLQKVSKPTGKYLHVKPDQSGRIPTATLNEWRWPDGQDGMAHNDNWKEFQFAPFNCDRYKFDWAVGNLTVDHADFNLIAMLSAMAAQQAMTARTVAAISILSDSTQFGTTATATVAGGGFWGTSSITDRFIAKGIQYAGQKIQLATLAAVGLKDMILIMNPVTAGRLANSGEIAQYLAQSPFAWGRVTGEDEKFLDLWGVPPAYQGIRIVVDDTVKATSGKGATLASQYVLPDNQVAMIARPGSLVAPEGSPSFSSLTMFAEEEMTVEVMRDTNNRRTVGRVVENWDIVMTAPASAFLFTAVLS